MKRRWKKKTHPRTSAGPTRGKYRQMWKRRMWDMVPGEEDMTPDISFICAAAWRETS